MRCPRGCGEMLEGQLLWVCGWCGASEPRVEPELPGLPETVEVPGGEFWMGSPAEDSDAQPHERPIRLCRLSTYRISLCPVTNGHYARFVKGTGYEAPELWKSRPPLGENARHPVCFVTWHDAITFCRWLSETAKMDYRLPTEAQWEKAARGGLWLDGDHRAAIANPAPARKFPHDRADLSAKEANFGGLVGSTTPVGAYPAGSSPYGCLDMVGNVSEWCLDAYLPDAYAVLPADEPVAEGAGLRVVRGGSWRSEPAHARCSNRYFYAPERSSYGIGFRVVVVGESAGSQGQASSAGGPKCG